MQRSDIFKKRKGLPESPAKATKAKPEAKKPNPVKRGKKAKQANTAPAPPPETEQAPALDA